jgi:hypothetical protein
MAFTAAGNVSALTLGNLLKIYSTNGIYSNLSDASEIWKYFMKQKAGQASGRQLQYMLRTSFGPASVQSLPADSSGDYPLGQRSGLSEGIAQYKEFGLTVNIPRNLLNKTGAELLQYAEPVTEELDSKAIAAARVMSLEMLGDGSGVIGVCSTFAVDTTLNTLTAQLSLTSANAERSHVGWFMEDDKIKFATTAGVAHATTNNAGSTPAYWKVISRDEDLDKIVFKAYTVNDALIPLTTATVGATDPASGDLCYRIGTTANDTTAISTNDYNTLSECLVGLPSLVADDGRKVNGITMTGAVSGSKRDSGGAAIDSSDFQKVLSKAKRRVGRNRYKYKNAWMYDTVYDALVESRETDRRFQSVDDGARGVKKLGYQHGNDFVEFCPDEFISKQRVWILPESKDVLQFYGKDFETVEPNPGQKFHLKTSSTGAGHARQMNTYMEGSAVVICRHPAAIAWIANFTA